ncbi:MAG TPA: hypothetical protein VGH34_19995 [Vicinamibacterales bacterium]
MSCDPALTALFTPAQPGLGRYEVCTTTETLEHVVASGLGDEIHFGDIEPLESLDAFGKAGPYNRSRLARLYGGTRVMVVHGWGTSAAGFTSVTLLSPYPDPSLTRLLPGTMSIRWLTTSANDTSGL